MQLSSHGFFPCQAGEVVELARPMGAVPNVHTRAPIALSGASPAQLAAAPDSGRVPW